VGSVSDVTQIQASPYVNQWVERSRDFRHEYDGGCGLVELPGSSEFGEQVFPSSTSRRAVEEDEDEDEIGSFFRGWKQDQAERRQQSTDLTDTQ
jgi:hypothetical protein